MSNENSPLRILVVDDDELGREVIALLLEHAGFVVNTADSGDAAMHYLNTAGELPPAVVLADIQMPGITGSALAQALRARCGPGTRLLAMSGSLPEKHATHHFDALLLKPFSIGELTDAIAAGTNLAPVPVEPDHRGLPDLNEAIYEKLAASMRKERLQQLYALCLRDVDERIARMRKGASHCDDAAFRREAHAIRGGTGMVGAAELQRLAGELEEDGIRANHVASLDGLMFAYERLRRILLARKIIEGIGTAK